jgi:hypothetical protein
MIVETEETVRPEWARLKDAACYIGIRPSRFYELVEESNGAIRKAVLRSPGAWRGAVIYHIPSILSYVDRIAEEQAAVN